MKKIILFFTITLTLIYGMANAQTSTDEKAVRAVVQKMEDAWNAHDFNYTGQYDIFDKNAILINPVGMYWKNRAEIIEAHKAFGEMMFKHTSNNNQQVDVRFLAPTVALTTIKTQYRVEEDHNLPDGKKAGSKGDISHNLINAVLTKKDNSWKIASLQVTEINPQAAAHDPIKRQASR